MRPNHYVSRRIAAMATAAFGFAFFSLAQTAAAQGTCQDNDPRKLCCQQWKMELFGPGGVGKGELIDNSYNALISERNRTQQTNRGVTFGPPQCWGNPVSPMPQGQIGTGVPCDSVPVGEQELCRTITNLRAKCQPACTQWDTVNGQWQCFAYNARPVGCPRTPKIAHQGDGGVRD